MKRKMILAIACVALILTGCVRSIYPYYTAKDLAFDPALVGVWSGDEGKETWTFEKAGEDGYKSVSRDANSTNEYSAHLFSLKGHLFLDCLTAGDVGLGVPCHYLFKVTQVQPTLKMSIFDHDWLARELGKNPNAIRHAAVPEDPYSTNKFQFVLTADTAELQKFVLAHVDSDDAFSETKELKKLK